VAALMTEITSLPMPMSLVFPTGLFGPTPPTTGQIWPRGDKAGVQT
jgi:hypothetical protein